MTLASAVNPNVAAVQVGGVAPVVGPGGVQAPAPLATSNPQIPGDGVDRIPHADVVLKDVLVYSNQRLTGPLTPLQTAQAQLALAQHKDGATPFGSDPRFGLAPGKESAGPAGKLGEAPGLPGQPGPNGEVINKAPQPGGPAPNNAAPPAQGQPPVQAPAPMPGQAGVLVNPNPPPPPHAQAARDPRRRERWRPRAPRQNPETNGREGSERNRGGG